MIKQSPLLHSIFIAISIANASFCNTVQEHSIEQLRAASQQDPTNVDALYKLAHALCMATRYDESLCAYRQLFALSPTNSVVYDIALVLKCQGNIERAIELNRALIESTDKDDSIHKLSQFALGISLLYRGASDEDWLKGWQGYEWRWQTTGWHQEQFCNKPFWDGCNLKGKTILIMDEQGLGDTFQFIRYLSLIKQQGARIIFVCNSALKMFLSVACDDIDQLISDGDILPLFDVQIHLLSLPGIFQTVEKTVPAHIPYLKADAGLINFWKEKIKGDKQFKIGICWQGNSKNSANPSMQQLFVPRSIDLKQLLTALSQVPHCSFYSLQKIDGEEQLHQVSDLPIHYFKDFDGTHGRFMDTAALIMNMDLIISVDTSVAHLAATLGKPTWILLPTPSDWRWMQHRVDTPWYPNMHLFRQKITGDWHGVLTDVISALLLRD